MTAPDVSSRFFGTNALATQTLYLNLFTNNQTIGAGTVVGSLTVASGGGYSQLTIAGTSWTGTATSGTCTVTAQEQTFSFTGTVGNIYGWALTTGSGLTGSLVAAEKFPVEQMIGASGDQIKMTPAMTMVLSSATVSYIARETFETPSGTDLTWSGTGGDVWNPDNTDATVLQGSQQLLINSAFKYFEWTPVDTVYYGFILRVPSAISSALDLVSFKDASGNTLGGIGIDGGTQQISLACNAGASSYGLGPTLATNTKTYFRGYYVKGTGTNAQWFLEVSTDAQNWSTVRNKVDATDTQAMGRFRLWCGQNTYIDDIRIGTSTIVY